MKVLKGFYEVLKGINYSELLGKWQMIVQLLQNLLGSIGYIAANFLFTYRVTGETMTQFMSVC